MSLRIGLAQCDPRLGDVDANLATHHDWIRRAQKESIDLLVFPELSLTGYLLQDVVSEVSLYADDPRLLELAQAAKGMDLAVGAVEESSDHAQYIACFYLEQGRLRHVHRKVYLATYGVFDEARFVGSGRRIAATDTRFGRMGIAICEDAWHPSLISLLLLDGADFLVVQVASPVRDLRKGELPKNALTWLDTLRTYARLYGSYIAFCNRVGSEDGLVYWGHSCLFGPDGEEVAKGPLYEEALVVGDIELERVREARLSNPILRDEKVDLTLRELARVGGRAHGRRPARPPGETQR